MAEAVLARVEEIDNGVKLGRITLNSEATLNSLSLEMIDQIQIALDQWRNDSSITAIFFDAAGEKAFSAGGDIQNLYHDMVKTPGGPCTYCEHFFEREYRLDYDLRRYPKPTIAWGHGIIMGGGLGIFSACQLRIGTETTRMAMPEITIGLFPDAGATYSFSKIDPVWAHFLALTGANINGEDAKYIGLLDTLILQSQKDCFIKGLSNLPSHASAPSDLAGLAEDFQSPEDAFPASQIRANEDLLREALEMTLKSSNPILTFSEQTALWPDEPWLNRASKSFLGGSPTTAAIIIEQFERAKTMDLKSMFQMELNIAVACSRQGEFSEGVRALLIEKDGNPKWQHTLGAVPDAVVESHFADHWQQHPLADLA